MRLQLISVKKILKTLFFLVLFVFLLLFFVAPALVGYFATRPNQSDVSSPPDGFKEVSLPEQDGVRLAAWYNPPKNGSVILIMHGAGGTRDSMRNLAKMLSSYGYGVLVIDQRGNGESTGNTNRFGWNGTKDVKQALRYVKEQEDVRAIGALGHSLGGEILLGAASECPEIDAIISDGATFRSFNEFYDLEFAPDLVRNISALRVRDASIALFSNEKSPSPKITESIAKASSTRFMLIAAGNVDTEIEYNKLFVAKAANRATLWVVPEVGHTGAFGTKPQEYEGKIIEFFNSSLLGS